MSALGQVTIQRTFTPSVLTLGDSASVKYDLTMKNLSEFEATVRIQMQTFTDDLSALFTVQSVDLVDSWNAITPTPSYLGGAIDFGAGSQDVTQMMDVTLSFVFTVQAQAIGTLNTFTSNNVWLADGNPVTLIFVPGSVEVVDSVCVAANSLVCLESGSVITIDQLNRGHLAKLLIAENQIVDIVKMPCPSNAFIAVKNYSGRSTLIRRGHPVLFNNMRINVEDLVGTPVAEVVCVDDPIDTYTVVTKIEDFICIDGIWVATWSESAWNVRQATVNIF